MARILRAKTPAGFKRADRDFRTRVVKDAKEAGTSDGAKKGWETRKDGPRVDPEVQKKRQAMKDTVRGLETARTLYEGAVTVLLEVAPPGREEQVKRLKMKKNIGNPFAVAWANYNRTHKGTKREAELYALELLDRAAALEEAASAAGLSMLLRKGTRDTGTVEHRNGSVTRIPIAKRAFRDDLKRKLSLRRVMHAPKPPVKGAA